MLLNTMHHGGNVYEGLSERYRAQRVHSFKKKVCVWGGEKVREVK